MAGKIPALQRWIVASKIPASQYGNQLRILTYHVEDCFPLTTLGVKGSAKIASSPKISGDDRNDIQKLALSG